MTGYLQLADGRTVLVSDGIVIGRVPGCDCVIDDTKASRRHARVVVQNGVVEIEDLDSSNGTLLNGKPVTRRLLRPGDQVQIGKTVLAYHEGSPPGAPRAGSPGKAIALDDDNDLFADTAPAAPAAVRSPVTEIAAPAASSPARPAAPAPAPPSVSPPVPPSGPSSGPSARPSVVEFADEIVEVRRAPPKEAPKTTVDAGAPIVATSSRILQFQKHAGGGGILGDDLAQMSGGVRSLVFAGVLLLAAGIVYGIVYLVR